LLGSWVKPIFIGAFSHLQSSTQQLSHYIIFNVKKLNRKLNLQTSGVLKRGWLANLLRQFKSPVPSQSAPFPKARIPRSPRNAERCPAAKLLFVWTTHSTVAGVSTGSR
jgi:hypothetical protein